MKSMKTMKTRVERILQGMHTLRLGGRKQPACHHPSLLREFNPSHGRTQVNVDACRGIEPPGSGAAIRAWIAIGRRGRVGYEAAVGKEDRPIGKPQGGIEIEAAGCHQLFARFQFKTVCSVYVAGRFVVGMAAQVIPQAPP